jgi:hypothetical protein
MSTLTSLLTLCSLLPILLAGCMASSNPPLPPGGLVLPTRGGEVIADAGAYGSLFGPFSSLNKDCSVRSYAKVRVLKKPANGTIVIKKGTGNPAFGSDSAFASCNGRAIPGTMVDYKPRSDYSGVETFQFEVVFADGERRVLTPTLTVRPKI